MLIQMTFSQKRAFVLRKKSNNSHLEVNMGYQVLEKT